MALERRTGRGKDVIDHPPGGNDDLCNSAAGALVLAASAAGLVLGEIEPLKQLAEASIETYSTRWLRTITRRILRRSPSPKSGESAVASPAEPRPVHLRLVRFLRADQPRSHSRRVVRELSLAGKRSRVARFPVVRRVRRELIVHRPSHPYTPVTRVTTRRLARHRASARRAVSSG